MKLKKIIIPFLILGFIQGCVSAKNHPRFSYSSANLTIERLRDIPHSEYNNLKKFVHNGTAHVIVHPAYYMFFHRKEEKRINRDVHEFISKQIERERHFIADAAKEKELVILIMPGKWYSEHYISYMNSLVQGSDSIFFMESKNTRSGALYNQDLEILFDLFRETGVTNIIVGGGYVGRCQKYIYDKLSRQLGRDNVFIAPEISSFSPSDISPATLKMLRASGNTIDLGLMAAYIRTKYVNDENEPVNITNINFR